MIVTTCSICNKRKECPLRRDDMEGYICLSCIKVMLKPEERLELYELPVIDRAILLFQSFPGKMAYFEDVYETLKNARRGVDFSYIAEHSYSVEVHTNDIGTFRMHWEEIDICKETMGYIFSTYEFCTFWWD